MQIPPAYSALKHKGKPLYYYARRGIEVKKEPRPVTIRRLDFCGLEGSLLRIRVLCSKGTYIRTLAADIGGALGCGAHLVALRRTRSGPIALDGAYDGSLLPQAGEKELLNHVRPIDDMVRMLEKGH